MNATTSRSDTINSVVDEFVTALVNSRLYDSQHPRIQSSIAEVQGHLLQFQEEYREDTLVLSATDDLLIFRNRPLVGASLASSRLLALFRTWCAGGITLKVDATRTDITTFFSFALEKPQPGEEFRAINRRLVESGVKSVKLMPPYQERPRGDEPGTTFEVPMRLYQSIVDILQDTTVRVCQGGRIDFGAVQTHAEEVLTRLNGAQGPMLSLARQDQYDAFTFGHSVRVAVLSMNFARSLTIDHELLIRIGTAALLHDVGKSMIPFEVLHSHGALSPDERKIMDTHTTLGAELLLDHYESDPLAIAAAFGHHCGCVDHAHDESEEPGEPQGGYPKLPHAHRLTLVTELVKVCDIYEALTAARPYKQPMNPRRAYRVMMSMGNHIDRKLLRRFIEVNGVWPVGELLELSTGEIARVLHQGDRLQEPIVELLRDRHGDPVESEEDSVVDLGNRNSHRREIVDAVTEDVLAVSDD